MNDEPKLTAPQRRYEIIGDSDDVNQKLEIAHHTQTPTSFDVNLADVFEGKLPVPESIQQRKIGMFVVGLTCHRQSGDVQAFGHTPEDSAETVVVHVPKDRKNTSILYLLDISSTRNE